MTTIFTTVPAHKGRRRKLILWSLPVVVLALLASGKTLGAVWAADQAATRYAAGEYEAAADAARGQLFLNVIEPWKAHFNLGDAYVGLEVLDEAEKEFETALGLAGRADQCIVRVNLALLFELRGDAAAQAGVNDEARAAYDEALAVIAAADEGCFPPEDKPKNSQSESEKAGEELAETGERVEQKKGELGEAEPSDEPSDGDEPAEADEPSDSQLEQLEQELKDSAKERSDSSAVDRAQDSDSGFADKPW